MGDIVRQARVIRIVFFGTPAFAVPTLNVLVGDPRFEVVLVVTPPDGEAGRGRRTSPSPVKIAALQRGLPLIQPTRLGQFATRDVLAAAQADLFVVAAYGEIFGPKSLALPRLASVNLHASLLPRFRGASPISAALLSGLERTGISLMIMDTGLDTGPILTTREVAIATEDTTATLTNKLARLCAEFVPDALACFIAGELVSRPQRGEGSITRTLTKFDGWINWYQPARTLALFVRAMWSWPRAWTTTNNGVHSSYLQIHSASVHPASGETGSASVPGTVIVEDDRLLIRCEDGLLEVETGQVAGGRPVNGAELIRGRHLSAGQQLGRTGAPPPRPPLWLSVVDQEPSSGSPL
ncbi:MAG: methionyl-tRNA formyltransferase [Chloroflexia bacterium]|nr:methionyl-tRNA formyltransferase [Chloroflexia bacterium]